jgi:hypothetical protein
MGLPLVRDEEPACYYWSIPLYTHTHTYTSVGVIVTLRLAVYRQSVRLGAKPLETRDTVILFSK